MQKDESGTPIPTERIEGFIYQIRGLKVLLDRDLALLYGVETKKLVQAVKRNIGRFPEDFMFQLSKEELENLMSQIVTSSWGGHRKPPMAFTEQGVAMLSGLLRSPQAVAVNISIMRAFIRMREFLGSQKEFSVKLDEMKSFLLKHSRANDKEFRKLWDAFEKLSSPLPEKGQGRIGFNLGL
jgi:hypothetical protein